MTPQEYLSILSERIGECISKGSDYTALLENGFDNYLSEKVGEMIYHTIWKRKDINISQLIDHLIELGVSPKNINDNGNEQTIRLNNLTFTIKKSEAYRLGVKIGFCIRNNFFDVTRNEENAIARVFIEIDKQYPQWESEWNDIYIEISKQTKNADIAIITINALVRNKIKNSGLQYSIEHNPDKSLLWLKLENNRQICLPINHNEIAEICNNLPSTIQEITTLIDQIPSEIRINDDSRNDWQTA